MQVLVRNLYVAEIDSASPWQVRNGVAEDAVGVAVGNTPVLCTSEHHVNIRPNHRLQSVKVNCIIAIFGLQETELNLDKKW